MDLLWLGIQSQTRSRTVDMYHQCADFPAQVSTRTIAIAGFCSPYTIPSAEIILGHIVQIVLDPTCQLYLRSQEA